MFFPKNNPKFKAQSGNFLAGNPFERPMTEGFFYREKMQAIHYVAPDHPFQEILEVGGGPSGLTAMLYPQALITNMDIDPKYAEFQCNRQSRIRFICGDATTLPFENASFDAVTLFDVLEHIPDDQKAVSEALRVLRPGGFILISAPNEHWRFPYYNFMKSICPTDTDIMAEWGHVRRGYTLDELKHLTGLTCRSHCSFINPITVLCHDVAFSSLSPISRRIGCALLGPVTWLGYGLHRPGALGTETASCWQKSEKS
jgi:SAM-dependent methyltransferase